jgi:hypothetical protein
MMSYRLYFLTAEMVIAGASVFDSPTDEEAIEYALARADGRAMELWSLDRFVRAFPDKASADEDGPSPAPQPPLLR